MDILQEGRKEFVAWAGGSGKDLLDKFLEFRKKVSGNEANMDWWIKNKTPQELEDFMNNYKSKSAQKKDDMAGGKKIYNKDGWVCIHCTTYDAMKYYGKGTKWCIAGNYPGHEERGNYYFDNYLQDQYSGYYVVINNNMKAGDDQFVNNKWCVCTKQNGQGGSAAGGKADIWNAPDNTVSHIPGAPEIPGLPSLGAFDIKDGILVKCNVRRFDGDELGIPDGVKAIGNKAFLSMSRLPSTIEFPSSVETIGVGAFAETPINKVDAEHVHELGHSCFLGCDHLESVVLGEHIYKLPKRVFGYCDSLERILIKGAITELDPNFLEGTDTNKLTILLMGTTGNEAILDYGRKNSIDIVDATTMEVLVG